MEQVVPYFAFRDFPEGMTVETEQALLAAVRSNNYILGDAIAAFEHEFAKATGTRYSIGVGNGYDALVLSLKALGIGAGDEVILPANTFIATANAVVQVGARPVFADVDKHTYNLTAATAEAVISTKTKAIIAVHLYGQACEMEPLMTLATKYKLQLVEDFAQAHGATYAGQTVGSFGSINATSFYPTKNLGAFGDAGAVVTSDAALAEFVSIYRNYGQQQKYHNKIIGVNSRLDELQAAILQVKLKYLDQLNSERQRLAKVYLQELQSINALVLPYTAESCTHVYHIFSIRTKYRNELQAWLTEKGIATAIHYPVPVHLQQAYTYLGHKPGDFPVVEELAQTSLSLPLFPGMQEAEQQAVIRSIKSFFAHLHG